MSAPCPVANVQNIQTLRHIINQSKPNEPKPLHPPRKLQPGWLLPHLLQSDDFLWGRWNHWFETMSARKIIAPIRQIEWHRDAAGFKMLDRSLSNITKYGDWCGWNSWSAFDYFMDWLLFGFGHHSQRQLPEEKGEYAGANERLYQVFNLETLLAYPHDYFGDILAENNYGRGLGFFPTPMDLCQLMASMNFGDGDARSKTVCDPCVGTGRMLLVASNYSYRLFGQDINPTVIKATLVNGYLYAPWLVRPFPFFDQPKRETSYDEEVEYTSTAVVNFVNDTEMEQRLQQVRQELLTRTAEEYRDSAAARARLVNGLSRLRDQASQLARSQATELVQRFGEMGRRKFHLAA